MNTSQKIYGTAWMILALISIWASGFPQLAAYDPLSFPDEFKTWTHATSVSDGTGYHEIFVNPNGLAASRNKGAYPDGSKIMVASYESNGGPLARYTFMVKDAQLFSKHSDGWGLAGFAPDHSNVETPNKDQLFSLLHQ